MNENFRKNLRVLRSYYNLTQKQLVEKIPFLREKGESACKIYSKIETGEREVNIGEAAEFSKCFGMPLDAMCFTKFYEQKKERRRLYLDCDEGYKIFFPAVLDSIDGFDEYFISGVRLYKRFHCGDEVDGERLKELFLSSWNTSGREEALVNYLSVTFCDGFERVFRNLSIEITPYQEKTRKLNLEPKELLNSFADPHEQEQFFEKNYDSVLEAITKLKKNSHWQDIGDYYFALRHVLGVALCSEQLDVYRTIGNVMMIELSSMGNRYAEAYCRYTKIL